MTTGRYHRSGPFVFRVSVMNPRRCYDRKPRHLPAAFIFCALIYMAGVAARSEKLTPMGSSIRVLLADAACRCHLVFVIAALETDNR